MVTYLSLETRIEPIFIWSGGIEASRSVAHLSMGY